MAFKIKIDVTIQLQAVQITRERKQVLVYKEVQIEHSKLAKQIRKLFL